MNIINVGRAIALHGAYCCIFHKWIFWILALSLLGNPNKADAKLSAKCSTFPLMLSSQSSLDMWYVSQKKKLLMNSVLSFGNLWNRKKKR